MSPQAALTTLQGIIDAMDQGKGHWSRLLQDARGLSGESKIEILRTCKQMALMDDGEMGLEEEVRIASIASAIGIEPQD
jgi:hypothetical protein